MKARNWNDISFGLFLTGIGAAGYAASQDLPSGTLLRMGPGWLPHALAFLLVIVGLGLAARGLLTGEEALGRWAIRPTLFVLLAVLFFGIAIERLGFPLAVGGAALIGAFADRDSRLAESIGLALFLAVGTTLVFVEGLGLSLQIWPEIAR